MTDRVLTGQTVTVQGEAAQGLTFGILGSVVLLDHQGAHSLGSRSQRLLLSVLLSAHGRAVASGSLVDALWPGAPPADPGAALRTQLSRLRAALPASATLRRVDDGYLLHADANTVDAFRFLALVRSDAEDLTGLEAALRLWRGPALQEFSDHDFARPLIYELDGARAEAEERLAGHLLARDEVDGAVRVLEQLVRRQPDRERSRGLLMDALYRSGRHTEALATYQEWRLVLAELRGLEPSPALRAKEEAILRHTVDDGPARPCQVRRRTNTFVGRRDDVADVADLLVDQRMVTLWGPGGVGKTRLALEVANVSEGRYPEGVVLCELAAVRRGSDVVRALATQLGVNEPLRGSLSAAVVEVMATRRCLLVLDNCEHVLEGAARLAGDLVRSAPGVDILATSRERLHVDGEQVWEVTPLDTTGPASTAVELFVQRAQASISTFLPGDEDMATIVEICRRVDGLPLGLELAAARIRGLSVDALHTSIRDSFTMLTAGDGRAARHRSVGAVISWSINQLDAVERLVLQRLTAFAGRFSLAAACDVTQGGLIASDAVGLAVLRLVDRALVVDHGEGTDRRYSLLETTRAHAREMLERNDEIHAVSAGHARWAVKVAERAAVGLRGVEEPRWAGLIREHLDDCRLAHSWLTGHDPAGAVRLAAALRPYALWRGASEVLSWAETAAAAASATPSAHLSEALLAAATGGWQRGDAMAADACARAAVAAGASQHRRAGLEATADVALMTGDLEVASSHFEVAAAIAVDEGDDLQATWDTGSAAIAHAYAGRYEHALRLADETDNIARRCNAPSGFAFASYVRGEIVADRDPAHAVRLLDAAVAHSGAAGTTFVASLAEVTLASIRSGDDIDQAAHHCRSALQDWRRAGAWTPLWVTMRTAAQLLVRAGRPHDAAVITGSLNSSSGRAYPAFGRDSERLSELEHTLRQELGAQTFEEANARGAAMSAEETVSFALHSLGLVAGSSATG